MLNPDTVQSLFCAFKALKRWQIIKHMKFIKASVIGLLFSLFSMLGFAQEMEWEGLDLSDYPFIEGNFAKAERYSFQKNKLVIHISGGQGIEEEPEPYTAREHAEILYNGFKNFEYTNSPTEIIVFYYKAGKNRVTKASVVICGEEYTSKSGETNFSPAAIGNAIDIFTKRFYQARGWLKKPKKKG